MSRTESVGETRTIKTSMELPMSKWLALKRMAVDLRKPVRLLVIEGMDHVLTQRRRPARQSP